MRAWSSRKYGSIPHESTKNNYKRIIYNNWKGVIRHNANWHHQGLGLAQKIKEEIKLLEIYSCRILTSRVWEATSGGRYSWYETQLKSSRFYAVPVRLVCEKGHVYAKRWLLRYLEVRTPASPRNTPAAIWRPGNETASPPGLHYTHSSLTISSCYTTCSTWKIPWTCPHLRIQTTSYLRERNTFFRQPPVKVVLSTNSFSIVSFMRERIPSVLKRQWGIENDRFRYFILNAVAASS